MLDYRIQCGVPASPVEASLTDKANSSKLDGSAGEEEEETSMNDSNPFTLIVSEGESSGEEEGESSGHPYTKQQDAFIQEATNRRTNSNQHCMYRKYNLSIFTKVVVKKKSERWLEHR